MSCFKCRALSRGGSKLTDLFVPPKPDHRAARDPRGGEKVPIPQPPRSTPKSAPADHWRYIDTHKTNNQCGSYFRRPFGRWSALSNRRLSQRLLLLKLHPSRSSQEPPLHRRSLARPFSLFNYDTPLTKLKVAPTPIPRTPPVSVSARKRVASNTLSPEILFSDNEARNGSPARIATLAETTQSLPLRPDT